MNNVKSFSSIEAQVQLLKTRGLSITKDQIEKAKDFLINNNYYRVSGYSLTLRKDDIFHKNATLDVLIEIYEADRRMRHIMLSIIEVIEVRIKSLIAYYHSEKYGPLGYLDINNYNCSNAGKVDIVTITDYLHVTRKAASQKDSLTNSELFLKHHKENKEGELPFWVYVEILTISDISKFFTILEDDIQTKIAMQLGFKSANGNDIVKNLLHCVTILRNICAHGGRIYNRLFIRKPWLSRKEKVLLRNENGTIVFDKLFSYILVLKSLTTPLDFKIVTDHIKQLSKEYKLVNFKFYGFPDNWENIL